MNASQITSEYSDSDIIEAISRDGMAGMACRFRHQGLLVDELEPERAPHDLPDVRYRAVQRVNFSYGLSPWNRYCFPGGG